MPNIKPVSDLRNYSDVLHDVTALDMQDFEKMQATLRVMNELAKGRKSGEEKRDVFPSHVRCHKRRGFRIAGILAF